MTSVAPHFLGAKNDCWKVGELVGAHRCPGTNLGLELPLLIVCAILAGGFVARLHYHNYRGQNSKPDSFCSVLLLGSTLLQEGQGRGVAIKPKDPCFCSVTFFFLITKVVLNSPASVLNLDGSFSLN